METDAVHQPDAMVVVSRDTCPAEAAVLASCWFCEATGATTVPGMKKNPVVGISLHLFLVVFASDE